MWDNCGYIVACVKGKLLDLTRDCKGKGTGHNYLSWELGDWGHDHGEIV